MTHETKILVVKFSDLEGAMMTYQSMYRAANSMAATLAVSGFFMSFTPLAPVGWVTTGSGVVVGIVTEFVDTAGYQAFKNLIDVELGNYNR